MPRVGLAGGWGVCMWSIVSGLVTVVGAPGGSFTLSHFGDADELKVLNLGVLLITKKKNNDSREPRRMRHTY